MRIILFFMSMMVFCAHVWAEGAITWEALDALYPRMCELQLKGGNEQALIEGMEMHLHPDVQITLFMKGRMLGVDREPQTKTYTKAEMIQSAVSVAKAAKIEKVDCSVQEAKIAPDGRSAEVKAKLFAQTRARDPNDIVARILLNTQEMICMDSVLLTAQDVIQIRERTCDGLVQTRYEE